MKTCSSCHRELSLDSFHRNTGRPDGRQRMCKSCATEYQRAIPMDVRRDRWLQRTYGISLKEYEERLAAQDGVCRICRAAHEKPLVVDHDHACCTSRRTCGACVRGLICDPCNRGLGAFRDDPERLAAAITYLKEF